MKRYAVHLWEMPRRAQGYFKFRGRWYRVKWSWRRPIFIRDAKSGKIARFKRKHVERAILAFVRAHARHLVRCGATAVRT